MPDTVRVLGEVAWDVLQRMVREMLARKAGGHLVEAHLDELDLRLPLFFRGAHVDPGAFSEELVSRIEKVLDDAIQRAAAFRPGHAFCHRCGRASCDHSRPPSCRHVFVGYAPTGTPLWQDFAQHCLERKHPEVDRLYGDPPAFLTLVQTGEELGERLLEAFQAPSYELKGQLLAGFFPLKTKEVEGRGVLALTLQVVATRASSSRPRLALNILGVAPRGEELGALWERYHEVPWRRAVRWAQSALSSIHHGRPADGPVDQRLEGVLRGTARRLERDLRSRGRRTRHAEQRHRSGHRPTRKALDDIQEAGSEDFLVDERTGTVVVLGDRGRTHFFTPQGRLVSSVRYSRDAIEKKRKLGLWRAASPAESEGLRQELQAGNESSAILQGSSDSRRHS